MSNINTQSWLMNRRHALKGLGTFIALPMLDCMTPLMATERSCPSGVRSFICPTE